MNKRFKIEAKDGTATVYVYDEIGVWGVTASEFAKQIDELGEVANITARINSPGGDVFDGLAMYNLLLTHQAKVQVEIDGMAASAASLVAMAGDDIRIAKNGFMLIHPPWAGVVGGATDMRNMAAKLDAIESKMVETYSDRRGIDREQVQEWVTADTMMDADQAVDVGMADALSEATEVAAKMDFSGYFNIPEILRKWRPPAKDQPKKSWRAAARKRWLTQMRNRLG